MPDVFEHNRQKRTADEPRWSGTAIFTLLAYLLTLFISSGLMFIIEPFVAKMVLPIFGGSPSVWNTCVVFFQLMLLAGYMFAHLISTRLTLRHQLWIQGLFIWLPIIFLPVRFPPGLSVDTHPVLSLLYLLAVVIGVVFFAISTTAPLLQKWYSQTSSIGSSDPYFLYASSNAGGLLGLMLYPFVLEPNYQIAEQSQMLLYIYLFYACLFSLCGILVLVNSKPIAPSNSDAESRVETQTLEQSSLEGQGDGLSDRNKLAESLEDKTRLLPQYLTELLHLRSIVFAMIPSSLVLGLTAYITSELSAVPFFWVAPLFIYLASYVLAFTKLPGAVISTVRIAAPILALLVVILVSSHTFQEATFGDPLITTGLSLHLLSLFLVCFACHSIVASQRPSTTRLTEYYVAVSVGGILGSSFNTFLAPFLFKDWTEYPLVLLVAATLLVRLPRSRESLDISAQFTRIVFVPVAVLVVCALSYYSYDSMLAQKEQASVFGGELLSREALLEVLFQVVVPLASCFVWARSTTQLRAGLAVFILFFLWSYNHDKNVVYQGRNFFGSLSVVHNRTYNTCEFWHGHTIHGTESLDPEKRGMPTSYFFRTGPIGTIMCKLLGEPENWNTDDNFQRKSDPKPLEPFAVLGLGCGTTAAYAKAKQTLDFYEINQDVIDVASNPFYFTYLFQAKQRNVDLRIVHGDARLEIQKAPYEYYKLILVDAFSSDSIPMHLITKEAAEIYFKKLKPAGVLAFNISNMYYDLKPVLARLSEELKVTALVISDPEDSVDGERYSTEWVVYSRSPETLATLKELGCTDLKTTRATQLWTDSYCSPLSVLSIPLH